MVSDALFAVPSSSSWSSEEQKLIQTGHMTPFGTSDLTTPPQPDLRVIENGTDISPDLRDPSRSSLAVASSSGLRLCSEGFDGLFQDPSPSLPPRRRKSRVSPASGDRKKKKGKEKKRVGSTEGCDECEGVAGEGMREGGVEGEWMPTRKEVEAMEREMAEHNDWNDDEEGEDESTEYSTDEEMGAGITYIQA